MEKFNKKNFEKYFKNVENFFFFFFKLHQKKLKISGKKIQI